VVQKGNGPRPKLKGKQEGGREIEGMKETWRRSSKATEVKTNNAMTISVAEEAENAISVGDNGIRSNRECRENKCSGCKRAGTWNRSA